MNSSPIKAIIKVERIFQINEINPFFDEWFESIFSFLEKNTSWTKENEIKLNCFVDPDEKEKIIIILHKKNCNGFKNKKELVFDYDSSQIEKECSCKK